MTAQGNTDDTPKVGQSPADGDGIDGNQGPLAPMMKKPESNQPPSDGGDGLDPNQKPVPLSEVKKKTGNQRRR